MSLETRLAAFISAVGADIKALNARKSSQDATFTDSGAITTFTGTHRFYASAAGSVTLSRASLGTTGTTTTTVVIKKNGVSALTLSLTSGTATITSATVITLASGDYLTVDVTAAGTGAQDLTVQLRVVET